MLITRATGVMAPSRYHIDLLKALDPMRDRGVVIVPEQYTLQAERDLLQALQCEGLFHIEVVSFKRLWHQWAKRLGLGETKVISELGRKMLLRQVLLRLDSNLERYRGNYRNRGFLNDLSEMLSSFRENRLRPELLSALARQGAPDTGLDGKLKELAAIYTEYTAAFTQEICDESYWIDAVIQGIYEAQVDEESKALFVVEGFSSMTQQEIDLLCALRGHATQMAVRLVDLGGEDVCLRYPKRLYHQLVTSMTRSGWTVDTNQDQGQETPSAHAFRVSFDDGVTAAPGAIYLGEAQDREAELMYACYQMVRHYQQGMPWEAMAILSNQPESYAMAAKRLTERFKIPCFIDTKRPAAGHYAIDFTLASLRAIANNYKPEAVLKVLKAGLILPQEALWSLENFSVSKGIRGRLWLEDWTALGAESGLEAHRKAFMTHLESLRLALKAEATGTGKVGALRQYLSQVGLFEGLAAAVAQLKDQGSYERAEELAQVHNIIDHVLYQVYVLGDAHNVGLEEFIDLLQLGFDSYEIAIIPPYQHYVTFGNIQRTRLQDLKLLFVVGVIEGEMPSRVAPKGLLSDSELSWLVDQGAVQLPPPGQGYDEEVYKTYEHLLRVAGPVYWTAPRVTSEGLPLRPSLWMGQLKSVGMTDVGVHVDLADLLSAGLKGPYLDLALKQLAAHVTGDLAAQLEPASLSAIASGLKGLMVAEAPENFQYSRDIGQFLAGLHYSNRALPLPEELVRALYGDVMRTSVTRLESFSRCPYQHFTSYGLRPQQIKTQDLSGLDLGDLFHGVFEGVLNAIKAQGAEGLDGIESWEETFETVFEAICSANERFGYSPKNLYFKGRLKGVVKRALGVAVAHMRESQFKNRYNELSFGIGLSAHAPALTLETAGGAKVVLEGKVDRIDAYEGPEGCFVSVLDYKSSKQTLALSEIYHGLKLQLMLYLDVAVENGQVLFGQVTKPFGAFYFKVDEPTLSGEDLESALYSAFKLEGLYVEDQALLGALDPVFAEAGQSRLVKAKRNKDGGLRRDAQQMPAEALETLRQYSKAKANGVAEAIYAGEIDIAPVTMAGSTACAYCEYRPICHFDDKKRGQRRRQLDKIDDQTCMDKMKEVVACRGQ